MGGCCGCGTGGWKALRAVLDASREKQIPPLRCGMTIKGVGRQPGDAPSLVLVLHSAHPKECYVSQNFRVISNSVRNDYTGKSGMGVLYSGGLISGDALKGLCERLAQRQAG